MMIFALQREESPKYRLILPRPLITHCKAGIIEYHLRTNKEGACKRKQASIKRLVYLASKIDIEDKKAPKLDV